MKTVSVIIPIYNIEEKLLRRCIESCLNQTEKNIEIILVDDGSENNALEVCKSYAHLENVRVIHQENQGVSVARNVGIEVADSEWVMFVDPDDYIENDCIEILLNNSDENTDIVQGCCYWISDYEKELREFFDSDIVAENEDEKLIFYDCIIGRGNGKASIGAPWGKIYRKKFLNKNGIAFLPQLKRVQDCIFNQYAFYFAHKIKYINYPVYDYFDGHLKKLHKEYNPNLSTLYLLFAKERYNWLKKLNLCNDEKILKLFYEGTPSVLMMILNNGAFHSNRRVAFSVRCKEANELLNNECFQIFLNYHYIGNSNETIKGKVRNWMLCHRAWFLLYIYQLLSKIKNKNKD